MGRQRRRIRIMDLPSIMTRRITMARRIGTTLVRAFIIIITMASAAFERTDTDPPSVAQLRRVEVRRFHSGLNLELRPPHDPPATLNRLSSRNRRRRQLFLPNSKGQHSVRDSPLGHK